MRLILLLLTATSALAEPTVSIHEVRPAPTAWSMVRDLPEAERQALVDRLVAEGLVQAPRPEPAAVAADGRALQATVEVRLARARAAMLGGAPDEAIAVLRPVREDPRVAPFWQEAVDTWVYAERERAGRAFLAARRLPAAERVLVLGAVRDRLAALAVDHPESLYAEPVLQALERVERAIDTARRTVVAQHAERTAAGP